MDTDMEVYLNIAARLERCLKDLVPIVNHTHTAHIYENGVCGRCEAHEFGRVAVDQLLAARVLLEAAAASSDSG